MSCPSITDMLRNASDDMAQRIMYYIRSGDSSKDFVRQLTISQQAELRLLCPGEDMSHPGRCLACDARHFAGDPDDPLRAEVPDEGITVAAMIIRVFRAIAIECESSKRPGFDSDWRTVMALAVDSEAIESRDAEVAALERIATFMESRLLGLDS